MVRASVRGSSLAVLCFFALLACEPGGEIIAWLNQAGHPDHGAKVLASCVGNMRIAMQTKRHTPTEQGQASYQAWRDELAADPEYLAVYAEEAAKKELWLQLAEARHAAGLTQAEMANRLGVNESRVARIEKRGYDACTLATLRRYVDALGVGYELSVPLRPRITH